jgi:UDP-N-acetylglucosamine 2-epimerase (non-hydrolysing)
VENTSRDVGIAFANELAQVCEELDVNVYEVIRLANRHPRVNVLTPGPGVGGHCIPIDPWFLVEGTKSGDFMRMARNINDARPAIVAQKAIDLLTEGQHKVGILGVAYKADVDDCRETPADAILDHFKQAGLEVKYHDPFVPQWRCDRAEHLSEIDEWADVLILVTDHGCYQEISLASPLLNTRG